MPEVTPFVDVRIRHPHNHYGYVESKPFSYRADANADANWMLDDGLYLEKNAGIVILRPVYLPTDNSTTSWTTTGTFSYGWGTVDWQEGRLAETEFRCAYFPAYGPSARFSATTANSTIAPRWWLDVWCSFPSGTSTTYGKVLLGAIHVDYPYATNVSCRYRVGLEYGKPPYLAYSTNYGTSFNVVDRLESGISTGFGAWARIMFLGLAGNFNVAVDNSRWLRHSNRDAFDLFDSAPIRVTGTGVAAAIAWHPLYFMAAGTGTSINISKPVITTADGTINVVGARSAGQEMFGTLYDSDTYFAYDFVLSSPAISNGYATTTPILRAVEVKYPARMSRTTSSVSKKLDGVTGITELISFDPASLNIYNETIIDFNNEDMAYTDASGVRACDIDLGFFETTINRRLTGYSGHLMQWLSSEGKKTWRLYCHDRSIILRPPGGVMVANLPYMDGWCIYRAIRYLANYGGITDEALSFPLCDGDINNPCGHYLLPYGDDFHPLMRFPSGMFVWQCMQKIQQYCGYLLYFDAGGRLQFYRWIPSAPGPYKKRFTLRPEVYGQMPALNEMFLCSRTRDMRNVRNDVTIIGIDPATHMPIVAHDRDNDSIYNIYSPNFLGYRSSFVWADSMFCTTEYAEQALNSVFGAARVPIDSIQVTGWMQPDLFPLDVISCYDPHATDYEKPYWILSIENSYRLAGSGMQMVKEPTCRINAQWLTPFG